MKKCSRCDRVQELAQFRKRAQSKDGLAGVCKECRRKDDNEHYAAHPERREYLSDKSKKARRTHRQFIYDYLLTHPCITCGEADPVVLQFDHRDEVEKVSNISALVGWSIKSIQSEISKCDVLCANCHARRTATQFGWYSWLKEMPQ